MTTPSDEQPKHDNTPPHESAVQRRLRTAEQLADQLRAAAEPPAAQPPLYTRAPAPAAAPPPPPQPTLTAPVRSLDPPVIPLSPDAGLAFDITVEDIYAYNRFCVQHVSAIRSARRRAGVVWLLVALAMFTLYLLYGPTAFGMVLLWAGLTALIVAITQLFFLGFLIKKQIAQGIKRDVYKHTLGRQVLSLDAEGYVVAIEGLETRRSWALVSDVAADERYLYLFVNPRCANIIPRRACATDQQWSDLRERIRDYYGVATSGQKAPE